VSLVRRHETDAAVTMLGVVPGHKFGDPGADCASDVSCASTRSMSSTTRRKTPLRMKRSRQA
jgi:hypothetical protein